MNWSKFYLKKEYSSQKNTISFSYNYQHILFFLVNEVGIQIDFDWLAGDYDELGASDENKKYVLRQGIEQGIAVYSDNQVIINNNDLFSLPIEDIEALRLDGFYRMGMSIRASGMLHKPDFCYEYDYFDGSDRTLVGAKRIGVFLEYGKKRYLLAKAQYELIEAIDKFNKLDSSKKGYEDNLLVFSEIKGLSAEVGAKLDQYLTRENVVAVDAVGATINFIDEDTIKVTPVLTGAKERKQDKFGNFAEVKAVYDLSEEENGRTRVVLSERAKSAVEEIKRLPIMKGLLKDDFLKNPQKFIDPETIDIEKFQVRIEEYSDRVQEIGVYKFSAYAFESGEKNPWLPERLDGENGTEDVSFKIEDLDELQKFEATYKKAEKENADEFVWKGKKVATDLVNDDYLESLRQDISTPRQKEHNLNGERANELDKKILIIKQNIDELEYNPNPITVDFMECDPELPGCFSKGTVLLEHQKRGVSWLQFLFREKLGGCLLADDMGLGKTLQILAFVVWQMEKSPKKPTIIIGPVALLENWYEEYHKFFTKPVQILNLHGRTLFKLRNPSVERGVEYSGEPRVSLDIDKIRKHDIVFTTYEAVRDYQFSLGQIEWSVVVTDESQKIKTPSALVTAATKALKADFRIACTATPVENSLVDFWCIMDFAKPGKLGSLKEYLNEFVYPLRKQNAPRELLVSSLREGVKPCLLRRMKKNVLTSLPEKHEHYERVPLSQLQIEQYVGVVGAYHSQQSDNRQGAMLKVLHQLREISSFPDIGEDSFMGNSNGLIQYSGKLQRTIDILNDIKTLEEKVIIFTEQRRFQRIIARVVNSVFKLSPAIVNGEINGSQEAQSGGITRKRLVDVFQQAPGFGVIVMSPQAAGYGLNIVGANHVIHFSRMWNPAKEDQATDRVYRIGQVRPVHVYYLITEHPNHQFISFDERLQELLQKKRDLATDFLYPSEGVEVRPEDFSDLINNGVKADCKPLRIDNIDKLKPLLFEGAIAVLYEMLGYSTFVTPGSGDYGVDVVCLSSDAGRKSLLIQCKQLAQGSLGIDGIADVSAARPFYQNKLLTQFETVVVTNRTFNQNAVSLAKANRVKLVDRDELKKYLSKNDILMQAVYEKDSSRQKI